MQREGLECFRQCRRKNIFAGSIVIAASGLLLFSCLALQSTSNDQVNSTLTLVHVVFRHGDRTPTNTYPKDPYGDPVRWPMGWGALTQLGMRQMHSLGVFLRNRYKNFLSDMYSPNEIYVVSSDHDRCLMSAELCLAGLYPPVGDQLWKSDLPWQPIPVHTVPKNLDQMIVMRKPCPAYDRELNRTYHSPYVKKIDSENRNLYEYLTENSGARIVDVKGVESLFDTLEIEERNNFKLPSWTEGVYPDKMKHLAALSLALFTHSDKQKRLKGGPLVKDIARHLQLKAKGDLRPDRRIFLYSGHDLNLVSTLRVLGFTELRKPKNAAAVIIELHRSTNDHYVEVVKEGMRTVFEVPRSP